VNSERPSICGYPMKGPGVPCGLPAGHELPHRPDSATAVGNVPSRAERQDAVYRETLGVEPGGELPSAIGGESRAGDDERAADRPRRARTRRWSAVTTTNVSTEADEPGQDTPGT
jgi:hypothetical protein